MNEQPRRNRVGLARFGLIAVCPVLAWALPAAAEPAIESVAAAAGQPEAFGALASDRPRIGTGLDVGAPDGVTASLVYRPIRALRVHAGISHNLISLGERVGVTVSPFSWWATPTLSLEYGRYSEGNANPIARVVTGDQTFSSGVLDRVGYQYANAHVGLEIGRKWFTFYLHAGASRITGTVHNLSSETMSSDTGTTSVTFSHDPTVKIWTVSARIGFVVYLAK